MLVHSYATMTFLSSIKFVRVAFFLMHISSAAAKLYEDLCDCATYGQPNNSSCVLLLFGNRALSHKGIYNIDNEDHGFHLPYFSGRSHFTTDNGGIELLYYPCGRTVRRMSKLLAADTSCVDECNIALVVHSLPRGGFTTGTLHGRRLLPGFLPAALKRR